MLEKIQNNGHEIDLQQTRYVTTDEILSSYDPLLEPSGSETAKINLLHVALTSNPRILKSMFFNNERSFMIAYAYIQQEIIQYSSSNDRYIYFLMKM